MITTVRALALAFADAYTERPDTWCQNKIAQRADGTGTSEWDPEARAFCAVVGAPWRAEAAGKITRALRLRFMRAANASGLTVDFNNTRTLPEIIAKLREIAGA